MNADEDDVDDEETLDEVEKDENKEEVMEEVNALQAEQDMPLEELLAKMGYKPGDDDEDDDGDEDEDDDDDEDEEVRHFFYVASCENSR